MKKSTLLILVSFIIFILLNYFGIDKNTSIFVTAIYVSILILYLFVTKKEIIIIYVNEIKSEIKLIQWPDKKMINQTALMVLIIVLLTSIVLWLIDSILTYVISLFI